MPWHFTPDTPAEADDATVKALQAAMRAAPQTGWLTVQGVQRWDGPHRWRPVDAEARALASVYKRRQAGHAAALAGAKPDRRWHPGLGRPCLSGGFTR